jgi:hypothetical protein
MLLRSVVVALLLANLLFFAWSRGWLAPAVGPPRHGEREPERLAAQQNPGVVTVLPPKAASAAVNAAVTAARAAARACMEAGPVPDEALAAAVAALAPAGLPDGSWASEVAATLPPFVVVVPPPADTAARAAREEELRPYASAAGGVLDVLPTSRALSGEFGGAWVLARYASRATADTALAAWANPNAASAPAGAHSLLPPLKGARVASLPTGTPRHWLRVREADAEVQTRLEALPAAAFGGAGFRRCGARP